MTDAAQRYEINYQKRVTPWRGDTRDIRVKAIKSDKAMSKKRSSKRSSRVTPQNWRLKKGRQVFQEKIEGWHPQLPPRVSPTLVTPLHILCCLYDAVYMIT